MEKNIFDNLKLSNPARRALAGKGIKTPKQLSAYSETEILALHGIIHVLKAALAADGLAFNIKKS